ncbi:hypothetical protein [Chromobacterium vaccinii]|uniref:hypothetical protein n=1 Tax=Chromobacterium vaccinii TaxID=1108595 RepID=UPI0031CF19FD
MLVREEPGDTRCTDRRIVISSDGGPVRNFDVEQITWFEIVRYGKPVFRQPLNGYFAASFSTGRQKGELMTFRGYRNNQKFFEFEDTAKPFFKDGLSVEGPKSILTASYRDAFGKDRREYFIVSYDAVTLLDNDEGAKRWQELQDLGSKVQGIELDQLVKPTQVKAWVNSLTPKIPAVH